MQKKSQDFSAGEAARLAQSDAGQQLLSMLQKKDPQAMQQAMQKATQGDYAAAMQLAQQLLADPQAQALLRQLGG